MSGGRRDTFQLVTGTATDPTLEQTFERFLPRRLLLERGIVSDDVLESRAFLTEVEARCELRGWLSRSAHSLEALADGRRRGRASGHRPGGQGAAAGAELELREIERYLAIRVVAWLRYVFAHLRASLVGDWLQPLLRILTGS